MIKALQLLQHIVPLFLLPPLGFCAVGIPGGLFAEASAESVCGVSDSTCLPVLPARDFQHLKTCLSSAFPDERATLKRGSEQVQKITYPEDGNAYKIAKGITVSHSYRLPAAVVVVENETEVIEAVKCATAAGYQVSPRGRRHHQLGLSSMDGYVVIDCILLCEPSEFRIERTDEDWLLPGQKMIGAITSGSGCTNAVMVAYVHKNFKEENGLYAIGTCPSVGITGYTTGGGAGDLTPYTGWAADDLLEVRMVLHNGTVVTANKGTNPDLLWASQGGGGGFGVITELKTAVIEAPEPPQGASTKFTFFYNLNYPTPDDDSRKMVLKAIQDYLYEADPLESSRYGGGGNFEPNKINLSGMFLGSIEEFVANFQKHGLLNENQMNQDLPTTLLRNFQPVPAIDFPEGLPSFGFTKLAEFNSYGEAMIWGICGGLSNAGNVPAMFLQTESTGDWCADLNISYEYCTNKTVGPPFDYVLEPNCDDPQVIEALVEAAYDPSSFLNNVGPRNALELERFGIGKSNNGGGGGLLIPKVDIETLNELAKLSMKPYHFQHGAPMTRAGDATAFPWRNAAILTEFKSEVQRKSVTSILANLYGGDTSKLQGYYNYMNQIGNPNWRHYFFGDNFARLSSIKSLYDPLNFFGNPVQVEPAPAKKSKTSKKLKGQNS